MEHSLRGLVQDRVHCHDRRGYLPFTLLITRLEKVINQVRPVTNWCRLTELNRRQWNTLPTELNLLNTCRCIPGADT